MSTQRYDSQRMNATKYREVFFRTNIRDVERDETLAMITEGNRRVRLKTGQ